MILRSGCGDARACRRPRPHPVASGSTPSNASAAGSARCGAGRRSSCRGRAGRWRRRRSGPPAPPAPRTSPRTGPEPAPEPAQAQFTEPGLPSVQPSPWSSTMIRRRVATCSGLNGTSPRQPRQQGHLLARGNPQTAAEPEAVEPAGDVRVASNPAGRAGFASPPPPHEGPAPGNTTPPSAGMRSPASGPAARSPATSPRGGISPGHSVAGTRRRGPRPSPARSAYSRS